MRLLTEFPCVDDNGIKGTIEVYLLPGNTIVPAGKEQKHSYRLRGGGHLTPISEGKFRLLNDNSETRLTYTIVDD